MDVHVRDLRYFLAVAEHLHFTRAAEALFMSQPALSKQVRALEDQLRVRLFERDRRTVRLTRAGAELVPYARTVVGDWEAAERTLAQAGERTLVLGMQTSPGRGLLRRRAPGWKRRGPKRTSSCARSPGATAPRAWPTAAPTRRSCGSRCPGAYAWVTIAREPRLVAMPTGHRLAGEEAVPFTELLDEPFLALPRSAGPLRDHWLALDERDGHPVRVAAEINDTEETYEAVATGIGVCLLAAGNAPIVDRGDVVMRPVEGLGPSELVLAYHERRRSPLVEDFARICREIVHEAGATSAPPAHP